MSILNSLESKQIVSFTVRGDGCVVQESCDGWYETTLSIVQLETLSDELLSLVQEMKNNKQQAGYYARLASDNEIMKATIIRLKEEAAHV